MSCFWLRFAAPFCIAISAFSAGIPTSVSLISSPNPSLFGQQVTLTATVTPTPFSGYVTFYDGTTVLGSGLATSGQVRFKTISLATGSRSLRAYFNGNGYIPSSSTVLQQTVNSAAGSGFSSRIMSTSGAGQYSVAVGDFNGDGKADVAIPNFSTHTMTILLGDGKGGFTAVNQQGSFPGYYSRAVAIGDFDRDGLADMAIADSTSTVTVLIGQGDGTFVNRWGPFTVGLEPESIVVGDFNGDGNPDLATANVSSNNVTVLLGDGWGNFTQASGSPFAAGSVPGALAVGDFNGDGHADLAVAGSGGVIVLLGNGSGGFTQDSGSPFAAGSFPSFVIAGDFNGDGNADLAVANSGSNNVTVLLGDGKGGFAQPAGSPFATGSGPQSIAIGDFNGDGKADMAIVNGGSNNVTVLMGDGRGGFTPAIGSPFAAGSGPTSIAAGDFNGDGTADLVVTDTINNIALLLGGYSTQTSTTLTTTPNPSGYGKTVTLTATVTPAATGTVTFYDGTTVLGSAALVGGQAQFSTALLASGSRSLLAYYEGAAPYLASVSQVVIQTVNATAGAGFIGQTPIAVGTSPDSVAVGDFNGDGKADLAVANSGSGTVTVLLGNGSGGFTAAPGSPIAVGSTPDFVVVGDFNGDGKADLAVANNGSNTVSILLGNGSGGFTPAAGSPFTVQAGPNFLAVTDFNADGRADLIVSCQGSGFVTAFLGNGSGGFTATPTILFPSGYLAVGDFNKDGIPDFAIANPANSAVSVTTWLGDGVGGFIGASATPLSGGQAAVAGDFNGDGRLDLAVLCNNGTLAIMLGTGNWGFLQTGFALAPGSPISLGFTPSAIAVGDFNADGKADLALTNSSTGAVTVLLGNGSAGFAVQSGSPLAVGTNPAALAVGDFNGDGIADLAVANSGSNNVTILLGTGQAVASVTGVSSTTPNGTFGTTAAVSVQIAFSSAVTVSGTPVLALNSGGSASYASGSGSNTLTFAYTVAGGQNSSHLDYTSISALSLNSGTITGPGGYTASLTLPAPGGAGSLGANSTLAIDTVVPGVTNVTSTATDGTYGTGSVISIQVSFNKPVSVTGTPSLALNSGGTATFNSGIGSAVLTFTYTVGATDTSSHLDYTSTGALTLNGGSIKDSASPPNAGNLTLATPGTTGSLGVSKNLVITTGGTTFSISGMVTVSGSGLSGVTMTLSGSQNGTTTTDSSGNYRFGSLAPGGNYTVTPSRSGYTFTPVNAAFLNLSTNQTSGFVATPVTYTISGQVTLSGSGLSGVTMTLSGSQSATTTTDGSGNYSFSGLAAGGNYVVTPSRSGYGFTPANASFNILSGNQTSGFVATLGAYTISGQVKFAGSGLSGVTLTLSGSQNSTATTDASGNYSFGALPAGANCVVVPTMGHYSFTPVKYTFNGLGSNQTADLTVNPSVGISKIGIVRGAAANNIMTFATLQDSNGNNAYDAGVDRYMGSLFVAGSPGYPGLATDIAVAGDWLGTGHASAGIYRPATGQWFLDTNGNGIIDAGDTPPFGYGGIAGDLPVVGDWNGLGKSCVGIFRQGFYWILDMNCNNKFDAGDATFPFGGIGYGTASGDAPVVGAWSGGKTRVGVVRAYAPGGVPQGPPFFWVLDSADPNAGSTPEAHQPSYSGATAPFAFGGAANGLDVFVIGDWLGTGTSHAGIYRQGNWLLDLSGAHTYDTFYQFGGVPTDAPIVGVW